MRVFAPMDRFYQQNVWDRIYTLIMPKDTTIPPYQVRMEMASTPTVIDPKHTGLLVIDMQNGFLTQGGLIGILPARVIIPRVAELIGIARQNHIHVIWTRVSLDNVTKGAYPRLYPNHFDCEGHAIFSRDSWHFQLVDEMLSLVATYDTIIDKDRYSAFYQTNLELILRQRELDTLLFAGVSTNVCVESSVRDAFQRDFIPIVISDCTGTFSDEMQAHSLDVISLVFGYVTSLYDLRKALSRDRR